MDHVMLTTHPRFVLLEPRPTPARVGQNYQLICPSDNIVTALLRAAMQSPVIAVDFETRGNDYSLPADETYIIGVGLAWDTGSCYLVPNDLSDSGWELLTHLLTTHRGLVAHNVYFDGGWIRRDLGVHANWLACTYGLYMQCASEGWKGQKWGLKDAMIDVLLWHNTNETELDKWLVENGYCKQNKAPEKGEMWRAPASIIGRYCTLDAEATYLLYTEHLLPIVKRFPKLADYHQQDFLPHVKIHIDQKIHGILTDRQQWLTYQEELLTKAADLDNEIVSHPLVAPHLAERTKEKHSIFLQTEPERYIKQKKRQEPEKFTKKGDLSKNWIKWKELSEQPPKESQVWIKWKEKEQAILSGKHKSTRFNLQSGDHLRWLLYDKLKNEVLLLTKSGKPSVDKNALGAMGPVGALLKKRIKLIKEATYLKDYLAHTEKRNTIHPSFKMPGTVTGRLAGKSPNVQQVPKTKGVLSGFISRPGYSFVDCDVNALEMVVTAELSQDKNLLALYGPGAKPNDIYTFYGSMMAGIGPALTALGYDPYNPVKEVLDATKKACKKERAIAKQLILSDNYGSGVKKKHKILSLSGIDMSLREVEDMHNSLHDAKEGVLAYVDWLKDEWKANGGWVENGYGLPICIDEKYEKDLLNRNVQGTGHAILQLYARIVANLLWDAGVEWYPIVMDWHDESIVEVRDDQVEIAKKIMEIDAYRELNAILGGTCPLKGSAAVAKSLAGIKLEE